MREVLDEQIASAACAHGAVARRWSRSRSIFGFIAMSVWRSVQLNNGSEPQRLTWQLWLFAAGSFAFGFALVPLYNVLCEVTGYGDRSKLAQAATHRRGAG